MIRRCRSGRRRPTFRRHSPSVNTCARSVVRYVEERRETLVPPLVLDELRNHADAVVGLRAASIRCTATTSAS